MKIEHVAFQIEDPVAAADWYCKHLGMTVKRAHKDKPWVRFLADDGGAVMLEFYNNPSVAVPDYRSQNPLITHIAFKCKDVADVRATRERLIAAGATPAATEPMITPEGDELWMLRDPWGVCIQLASRVTPMI